MSNMSGMYFCYRQNKSRGQWIIDNNVTLNVIIEAPSSEAADQQAKRLGIYFSGTETGKDCTCCGDRWDDSEGYVSLPNPDRFIKAAMHFDKDCVESGQPYCYVYSVSGEKQSYIKQ